MHTSSFSFRTFSLFPFSLVPNPGPNKIQFCGGQIQCEHCSLAATAAEILKIQSLLRELGVPNSAPSILCADLNMVALTNNPILHSQTKHMELDIFFVRKRSCI